MSLAFRTTSCSVNLETKQDWSLQGRPGWSVGPSSLWDKNWERERHTEQHHKWYHRWHVETLFKHWKRVFLQQSLRISRDDKEESQGKVTGRREINSGKPRLTILAIYGSFNCPFPFLFNGDLPHRFRKLTLAEGVSSGKLWLESDHWRNLSPVSKRGQGQSWQVSQEKLACLHVLTWLNCLVNRTKVGWIPTYEGFTASVFSSCGMSPGLPTWLLCSYSDTQPLTVIAFDQNEAFLARNECGCETYRVYSIK